MAEKVFDHLRDFPRLRGCVGRVHGPKYTQKGKTREKKVSALLPHYSIEIATLRSVQFEFKKEPPHFIQLKIVCV
jgi:hypothetical protein